MPIEASSLRLLTISGKPSRAGRLHLAPHREHREGRHRDAVIGDQLLRQVLAARQHQAARIAAGVGNAQQLEIARDVLVVGGLAVELLQQVEDDVRLPAPRSRRGSASARTGRRAACTSWPARAQRAHHVVLGLPDVDVLARSGPSSESGGIRSGCRSTRTRSCFIARTTAAATDCRASAPSSRSSSTVKSVDQLPFGARRRAASARGSARSSRRARSRASADTRRSISTPCAGCCARWWRRKVEAAGARWCRGSSEKMRRRSRS